MKSTEEKIKEVARKLFIEKGFKHTTIREIAKEAEVNISLMNYYFRSKDKLFQQILEEGLGEIAPVIRKVLEADLPLEAKKKKYIDEYPDLLIKKPDLPLFVLSEMRLDPARFFKISNFAAIYKSEVLANQLQEAIKQGQIKQITLEEFYTNLVALTVYPFIVSPVMTHVYKMDQGRFKEFILQRKTSVYEMVMHTIKK